MLSMVVAAIVSTFVLGVPVALAVDRRCRGGALVGLGYLYGTGVVWASLFALSLLRIRWSALDTTVVALMVSAACAFVARRQARWPLPLHGTAAPARRSWLNRAGASAVDVLTAYTVYSFALYATLARVWQWDFWAIWGLKARAFAEVGGIDWRFLLRPSNAFCHPDYPLLLPLNYDWVALLNGAWDDRWLALVGVAFGSALLLIIRSMAAEETSPVAAATLTFAATAFALSYAIGMADGPLIAFGSAAVLFIRRGILFDDHASFRHGAILLGLAGSTKNEGLALIAAVAIGLAFVLRPHWQQVLRLWPSVAIVAPWLVIRAILHLRTDITSGPVLERVAAHLGELGSILRMLIDQLPDAWMWILMLAAIVLVPSAIRSSERFVYCVVAMQFFFDLGAYLITPANVEWQIETSWPRVAPQVATPLLFAVTLLLARTAARGETPAHAEARSEQL